MRTRHLDAQGNPRYTNRLSNEISPYLRQHAHNPVDWYPWGEEAFDRARLENKPVFLSIGYSTCHWCHVMEHECFDDEAIAAYLNQHFISIKLDREVRPDIDEIYMTGVQLMTGSGGWPMSSFLTPEAKPFFAGTYFPPESFQQLLTRITGAWNTQQQEIEAQAQEVVEAIRKITETAGKVEEVRQDLVAQAVQQQLSRLDEVSGGMGNAPKFPNEVGLLLLWHSWLLQREEHVLDALLLTLDKMSQGGIYDQIGGGFHRYTVDDKWLIPHFEKMLYNQALLTRVYLKGYELTGKPDWGRVLEQTFDYLLREMRAPDGGFYSATDADSAGREGTFFIWQLDDLPEQLSAADRQLAITLWQMSEQGNFEGSNILHLAGSLEEYAAEHGLDSHELVDRVDEIRRLCYALREKREHPFKDKKIISAWNGMLISSLAEASRVLSRDAYLVAAIRCADYIWQQHWHVEDQRLHRLSLAGVSTDQGNLEDYAYLAEGFLHVFDETGDALWLSRAVDLTDAMISFFHDPADGGFFMGEDTGGGGLIARPKSPMDGAIASGNSVAVRVLAGLFFRTGEIRYRTLATSSAAAFASQMNQSPSAFSYMLLGVDELLSGQTGATRYAAHGNIRVRLLVGTGGEFTLQVYIAPEWHINSHEITQQEMIPTRLELEAGPGCSLENVVYPPGEDQLLAFRAQQVGLYTGEFSITGRVNATVPQAPVVCLRLQACNDELCLAAEELRFYLPFTAGIH